MTYMYMYIQVIHVHVHNKGLCNRYTVLVLKARHPNNNYKIDCISINYLVCYIIIIFYISALKKKIYIYIYI